MWIEQEGLWRLVACISGGRIYTLSSSSASRNNRIIKDPALPSPISSADAVSFGRDLMYLLLASSYRGSTITSHCVPN